MFNQSHVKTTEKKTNKQTATAQIIKNQNTYRPKLI